MTVQQLEGLCGEALGYLSRCTPSGVEALMSGHDGTLQMLRWWRTGFIRITPKAATAIRALIDNIIRLAPNKELVRPSSDQPSLDWMETPL